MKPFIKLTLIIFTVSLFHNFTNAQWVSVTSGSSSFIAAIEAPSTVKMYVAGFNGTVLLSTNLGQTWVAKTSPSASNINEISFLVGTNASTGWAASVSGIYKTTNEGSNWVQQVTGNHTDVLFTNENTGFALSSVGNTFKKTTNGGSNFTDILYSSLTNLFAKKFVQASATDFFILGVRGDSSLIFKSTNGGSNWGAPFIIVMEANGIDFVNATTGIVVANSGKILRTTNAGTNWSIIPSGTTANISGVACINNSMIFAAGVGGMILKSTNNGANWFQQTTPITANLRAVGGFSSGTVVLIGGAGGSLLRTTNGGITAVTQTGTETPEKYSLEQNYPNPFNPSTKINFSIPESGNVSLRIYDVMGREVSAAVNRQLTPGNYSFDLDASALVSGTYFYRLQAGSYTETRKMVLIK